jgi:2-keto-3-deoxy-L-rhamnonate aldolase RhmA
MNKSLLKIKLNDGNLALGSWISLAHPAIAEIMARIGFDWLAIDLEHSVITIREAEELIRVIDLAGSTPLVRLTSNDHSQIKRVMDAGSHGIIVPMVNSAEEAQSAVDAVKYPNKGRRGIGLARAQGYGANFKEYLEWQENHSIVIVQIEHIKAIENIEEILSVDGVDGFIIGPYDLSGSMGIPGEFDHPELIKAMEKVFSYAKKIHKTGGIHIVEPNTKELKLRIKEGHKFIAYSVDIRLLDASARSGISACKEELG